MGPDWLNDTDDEDEGTSGVAQALANPRATAAGQEGAVPEGRPQPTEQATADTPDTNRDTDVSAHQLANPAPPKQPTKPQGTDAELAPYTGQSSPAPNSPDAAAMTAPPVPVAPKLPDAESQRHELAHTIANFNPNAYKPSVGRRIGAALAGALTTFGSRSPQAGMQVGESALDAPLNRAKAAEQQREQALNQQINNTEAERSDAQQDYNNRVSQYNTAERGMEAAQRAANYRANAAARQQNAATRASEIISFQPSDPNNPWAGGTGITRDGRKMPNSAPPAAWLKDWSGTPQGKLALQTMTIQQREQAAKQMKLNPQETKYFVANGKLAEPSQHTTIAIRENPDGTPAQPRGRAGTPQNISDIVAKSTQDKQAFIDGWTRVADQDQANAVGAHVGDYVKGNQVLNPQEMHDRIDKFRTDANVKLNKYGAHLDDQGNLHTEPGQPNLTPEPKRGAQPQQQRPQQPQQRAVVQFGNGRQLTDKSIAQQYLAKAGGDKNKARQLAQQDNWKL